MQARTGQSRVGATLRLLTALVALATPPVLLAVIIGNPLPAPPIDWVRVVESIQVGLVPPSVWVNVLAFTAWVAWAVLVVILAVEVVAVARNRPSRPGVPGWIRHLAQVLVTAAIALAGPGQHALAVGAAAGHALVAAAPAAGAEQAPVAPQPVADGRTVTVTEGDSWGGFAAEVLGDASLGPALRAANMDRHVGGGQTVSESTAFVEPGWQLLIPVALHTSPAGESNTRPDSAEPATWNVERGDHFWGIAEATLAQSWGRAPTDAEMLPYWRQVIDASHRALLPPGDPDLIHPGQQFVVPAPLPDPDPAHDPAATAPALSPEREPAAGDIDPAAPADQAPSPDSAASAAAGGQGAGTEGHETPANTAAEPQAASDRWRAAIDGDAPSDGESTPARKGEARTGLGVPAGLTAGAAASSILATGVLAALRWRRRTRLQQRAPGMRLPTPLPQLDCEVAKLDAAAAPEETLDDLAALLASVPLDVHPLLVTATDDGQVSLLFKDHGALPDPPPPWTLVDDGVDGPVGWQAQLGDRGPERSCGIPLLVTLGRSPTSTIMANVCGMGTLALNGSPSEVQRRLRAMSLDLATSRVSFPVEVAIAGDDRLASLDRVRQVDDLADEIALALTEVDEVVIDDRIPRLLVCHPGTTPPEVPDELLGMVGVVTDDATVDRCWVLDLDDTHTGHLRLPDGGTVRLTLPDIDPDLLDDELSRLDEPASPEPAEPPDEPATAVTVEPSTNGHATRRPTPNTEPAWCEVRLLGPVEVIRDGVRVDGLTPRTLEILVYLATHREGVPRERLDDIIWAGRAARPGTQRVTSALTRLRKILGDGPDGKPLLARRSGDEPIVVSEHVGTDLDRALTHLALANDLPAELRIRELAAALDLVRGEALEGRAYSWATDLCQQAIVALQDAALDVARSSREADDLETAEKAIAQGLRLLDPNGWLYLERAHLERLQGRPEQPPRIFEQYRRKLADDADEIAGIVATPPPEIELAFRELMAAV